MTLGLRSGTRIYALTLVLVAVSIALALWLDRAVGQRTWFAPCFAAVAICAGFGGIGPGILATLTAALCVDYLLLKPLYSLSIADPAQALDLGMFLLVGAISSIASQVLHVAHHREE